MCLNKTTAGVTSSRHVAPLSPTSALCNLGRLAPKTPGCMLKRRLPGDLLNPHDELSEEPSTLLLSEPPAAQTLFQPD
eukprot:superscaffoldBa00000901_g7914